MATWKKVGENLVRHQGGTIYLRAKVAGKIIRRSLKIDDLAEAKRKREKELKLTKKRLAEAAQAAKTIEGALAHVEQDPHAHPGCARPPLLHQRIHAVCSCHFQIAGSATFELKDDFKLSKSVHESSTRQTVERRLG